MLKNEITGIRCIAIESYYVRSLSGGYTSGTRKLEGIGAGFVPSIFEPSLIDEVVTVSKEDAFYFAKKVALEEGIFVGISSGASLAAVNKKSSSFKEGSRILTFAYDTGERYLSVEDLF